MGKGDFASQSCNGRMWVGVTEGRSVVTAMNEQRMLQIAPLGQGLSILDNLGSSWFLELKSGEAAVPTPVGP